MDHILGDFALFFFSTVTMTTHFSSSSFCKSCHESILFSNETRFFVTLSEKLCSFNSRSECSDPIFFQSKKKEKKKKTIKSVVYIYL